MAHVETNPFEVQSEPTNIVQVMESNPAIALTDKQIAELFLRLCADFASLTAEKEWGLGFDSRKKYTREQVEDILNKKVVMMLKENRAPQEHYNNVYRILSTVLSSNPVPRQARESRDIVIQININIEQDFARHYPVSDYYYRRYNTLTDLAILTSFSHFHCHSHHHGIGSSNISGIDCKDLFKSEGAALLLLIAIAIILASLALFATYYILKELFEIGDRLFFNESVLRAVTSFATMLALGSAGASFGFFVFGPALGALIAAGAATPIGIIILATVCTGLITAGAGALLFNKIRIQDKFTRPRNPDAIDPVDPDRFSLTASQERNLEDAGFDILKVKCAMAAIRHSMGQKIHSCSMRLFKHSEQKEMIDLLRDLKRGKVSVVNVGKLKINCLKDTYEFNAEQQIMTVKAPAYTPPPSTNPEYNPNLESENYKFYAGLPTGA